MVIAAFKDQHEFKDGRAFDYVFEFEGEYNGELAELDGSALKLWRLVIEKKELSWDAAVECIGDTNLRRAVSQLLRMGYASGMRNRRIKVYAKSLYQGDELW